MGDTIELSALEFDVLWEHLQLGLFPPVLRVTSHGATLEERAELAAKAWTSLAERDLGWPTRLDARLTHRLRLLARPEWELDARIQLGTRGPRTSALIAANRATAVIAVPHTDRITLRTGPTDRISHQAVALLPPHPPGTGASITLPAETMDVAAARTGDSSDTFARTLRSLGLGISEARKIAGVISGVSRFCHFGVARTRHLEKRRRASHVVSVYDSTPGRYLFTRKPSGGRNWVTLVPGINTAIMRQIDELLAELNRP